MKSSKWSAFIAVIMLLISLVIFYFTVVTIDYSKHGFFNLSPRPDAIEYFAGAVSLYQEGRYEISVAGQKFPPRYPFGHSLLMVPFMYLGFDLIKVPFLVSQVFGFGCIIALFLGLFKERHFLAAGVSSLILTTFPAFIIFCRSPMGEVANCFFLLLSFFSFYFYVKKQNFWWGVIGSILLSIAVWSKIADVFFLPILALSCFAIREMSLKDRAKQILVFSTLFLITALPLLIYNYSTFGSPFKTGYQLWLPKLYPEQVMDTFKVTHTDNNLRYYLAEIFQRETKLTSAHLFGEGSYFGPTFVLLGLITLLYGIKYRTFILFFAAGVPFLFLNVIWYFGTNGRYVFPILLLSVPAVAVATIEIIRKSRSNWGLTLMVILLLVFEVIGYPGTKNIHYKSQLNHLKNPLNNLELANYLNTARWRGGSPQKYELVESFNQISNEQKFLMFTDIPSAPYVYALTKGERTISPLRPRHDYAHNKKLLNYTAEDRTEQMEAAISNDTKVYALVWNANSFNQLPFICPTPSNFTWQIKYTDARCGGIAELEEGTLGSFTSTDLLASDCLPFGFTVAGMGRVTRRDGKRWRFGLGPETVLAFDANQATEMQLSFKMINLIPEQSVLIQVNGVEVGNFVNLNRRGDRIEDTVEFEAMIDRNEIRIVYADWNHKAKAHFPKDRRLIAMNIIELTINEL